MDLYKKQGYQVVRLCLYQFGLTLFGLVVTMATQANKALFIGSGIFSALFYLYLVYTLVYELGQKDGIRIEAGKREYVPLTGFYLALAANALNILLGILVFVGGTVFDASGAQWAGQMHDIARIIAVFIQGMYNAALNPIIDQNFVYLLTPIPGLVVCTLAYILGVRFCHGVKQPKEKEDRYAPRVQRPGKKD